MRSVIAITFALAMIAPALSAAPVSGESVYRQRCASCHDSGNSRVPPRDELKKFSISRILRTLDFGLMNNIGTRLTQEEREAVAAYLGVANDNGQRPASAYCSDRTVKLTDRSKVQVSGANASPEGRSHQEISGANASAPARSHQEWNGWSPTS